MKLLYITNGIAGSGGLERVLSVKASMLAEDYGYEVAILGLNSGNENPFFEFSTKIKFIQSPVSGNPIQYFLQYKKGIQKAVKEFQPDVISVCDDGLKGFFIPRIIAKKIPIIYERHVSKLIEVNENQGLVKEKMTQIKFWLMNQLAKDFSRFVLLTNGNKNEWISNNTQIIPNPLPFVTGKNSDLQNKKVIAIGKQSYQKSYDRLLKIWSLLEVELSDWQLHIYGKENLSLGLENLTKELGIQNQVYFHPPEKKIEEKYLESSIFVLSSRYEGFGMVLIEAMECGLPCVSFDCPSGPADIISDGEDGFLVENGNLEQFAEKLKGLMNDFALRKEMGEKAKKSAKKYLPENIVKQWDELFQSLKS